MQKDGSGILITAYRGCAFIYSYEYKNQSSEQKESPFQPELTTTAGFQVVQGEKLTAHSVEKRFSDFLKPHDVTQLWVLFACLCHSLRYCSAGLLFAQLFAHFDTALQNAASPMPAGPC